MIISLDDHWGVHTILDITDCDTDAIRSEEDIKLYVETLVDDILNMERYGEPFIKRFGEGNKLGFTLLQPIHTSCVTAHFAEESNSIYLDVFSCRAYDPEDVANYTLDMFGGKIQNMQIIFRG